MDGLTSETQGPHSRLRRVRGVHGRAFGLVPISGTAFSCRNCWWLGQRSRHQYGLRARCLAGPTSVLRLDTPESECPHDPLVWASDSDWQEIAVELVNRNFCEPVHIDIEESGTVHKSVALSEKPALGLFNQLGQSMLAQPVGDASCGICGRV